MRFTAFLRLWVILMIGASPVLAGGALKITQVRTDGNYGASTFIAFPNGRNGIIDGGGSTANSNKLSTFLDATIGAGGTIWYMAMSHSHTDHYNGLQSSLNNYVVMRYYSSFPENDSPAQPSAGNTAYGTYTGFLNTEFSTPYTTNANCYEIIATGNPTTTAKVSGSGTLLGPGWDSSVDAMVISGDELTAGTASNENSVAYHIWYGSNTALSAGDMTGGSGDLAMEQTAETNYGAAGGRIYRNVQMFKVNHHGSNGSNTDAWFTAIAPPDPVRRYAWNCTGDIGNTPTLTADSAARITNSDRTWYRTDLDGNARFAAIGDGNWSTVRQFTYPDGGVTDHAAFAAPPSTGTLSGAASVAAANLSWVAATGSPVWYYIYLA
ncbi:MAG: MBL fold metallo-hydrolase, partial [bacterium]